MISEFLSVSCSAQMNTLVRGVDWDGNRLSQEPAEAEGDDLIFHIAQPVICFSVGFLLLKNDRDPVLLNKGQIPSCIYSCLQSS